MYTHACVLYLLEKSFQDGYYLIPPYIIHALDCKLTCSMVSNILENLAPLSPIRYFNQRDYPSMCRAELVKMNGSGE